MAKAARAVPEGFHTITPALTLNNAAENDRLVQTRVRRRRNQPQRGETWGSGDLRI
jgi:hypothetical protein